MIEALRDGLPKEAVALSVARVLRQRLRQKLAAGSSANQAHGRHCGSISGRDYAAKRAGGRRVVGKKIGLTSKAIQNMLGVSEPDYGYLFHDMVVPEGESINRSTLVQPKVEGEVAFLLKKDLVSPGLTLAVTGWEAWEFGLSRDTEHKNRRPQCR